MALSDSLAWQYGAQYQPTESTANGFYGVTIPLVERGIPLSITSLDQLSSVDDLKDVRLLLVSYDIMKPMREEINEILAQWVKEGGVLLSLGGHDAFEEIDGAWWGRNPLQNLIQHLGAGLQVGRLNDPSSGFSWTGDESHGQNLISLALDPTYGSYAATFFGAGYETILEASGQSIGIDCPVGKGRLIAVGLPSSYYSSHSSGPDMVRSLVEYATQYTGYRYVESNLMSVKRGNVVASHAMLMSETLEGNFINLLDASLPVVHSVEVAAGASSLLYDISNAMTEGTPRLAFTSGTLDGEVTETAGRTTLRLSGPEMTPVTARILGNGRSPSKVRVTLDGKDYRLSDYGWDNATGSLLLSVLTGPDQPVDIEIEWGDAPVADREPAQYASLTILTNEAGEDADYLVRNSGASANASIRYCDGAAELVYRFDLDEFDDAMFSCEVINNYVLSISDHDGDYQTIFDYSQISDERAESNNLAFLNFAPADYGFEDGPLYIRLSNTDPTKGHGGAIYSISIQYKK